MPTTAIVHGIPRPTHDLDFTITNDRMRLPELDATVESHGYSVPDTFASGWVDLVAGMPLVRIRKWIRVTTVDVDIFLAESSFQQSVMSRRIQMTVDAIMVWLVSAEDLVLLTAIANTVIDPIIHFNLLPDRECMYRDRAVGIKIRRDAIDSR